MNKPNKQDFIRRQVWIKLREVAFPDSRFHYNFEEFIPDFVGSDIATKQLIDLDIYKNSHVIFITPDNCLEVLRSKAIIDNKIVLMSTYGIRRGFLELIPGDVPKPLVELAVLLDAVEKFGRQISLAKIQQQYHIDLLVTGGSAVTRQGLRTGKGHGYFDIEWGIFSSIGVVDSSTPIVDIVHDCQIIEEEIERNSYDTLCDYIITPTQVIEIAVPNKPTGGIHWDLLEQGMLETILPLKELQSLEGKELSKISNKKTRNNQHENN